MSLLVISNCRICFPGLAADNDVTKPRWPVAKMSKSLHADIAFGQISVF